MNRAQRRKYRKKITLDQAREMATKNLQAIKNMPHKSITNMARHLSKQAGEMFRTQEEAKKNKKGQDEATND